MAQGAEATQTLESSASVHTLTIEGRSVGAQAVEVIASTVTSKKPNAVTAARRGPLTAADSTANLDAAAYVGSNNFDVGNSIHLATHCRFETTAQSATVFFVLFDPSDGIIGITRDYTFTADPTYKDASSGKYFSATEIVDIHAASQVFPVVRSVATADDVYIYFEAL